MAPIDPDTAQAGKVAAEHGVVLYQNVPAVGIAMVVGTLLMVKELLRANTWRTRAVIYISKLTVGTASAYIALLAKPLFPVGLGPGFEQLVAIIAFYLGKDAIEIIAQKIFGIGRSAEAKQENDDV